MTYRSERCADPLRPPPLGVGSVERESIGIVAVFGPTASVRSVCPCRSCQTPGRSVLLAGSDRSRPAVCDRGPEPRHRPGIPRLRCRARAARHPSRQPRLATGRPELRVRTRRRTARLGTRQRRPTRSRDVESTRIRPAPTLRVHTHSGGSEPSVVRLQLNRASGVRSRRPDPGVRPCSRPSRWSRASRRACPGRAPRGSGSSARCSV